MNKTTLLTFLATCLVCALVEAKKADKSDLENDIEVLVNDALDEIYKQDPAGKDWGL